MTTISSVIVKTSLVFIMVFLTGWADAVLASSLYPPTAYKGENPLLIHVATQCIRQGRQNGREILFNRCNTCRIVKLSRKRPDSRPAIFRDYTVPKKSRTELSFRGPGQTRVLSDKPCRDKPRQVKAESNVKRCTQLQRRINGDAVIINTCNGCREITTERYGAGGFSARGNYTIAGKSYVPFKTTGASKAKILSEKRCQ